ncbi:hypothetical protein Murru_2953 [Allomuricauda ruestringensis DSM 13258]|uniref:Uncharacterized protein n=1 Tax=Allomuricauda ruestringensis (strain DSM 13258 / CIP 107369 / LMG 19739 / B1) TaxID=886377 RepID=G2PJM5_ALLRU|nr:hypothetical protein Murru_2953 [Allomuricauda ruestringensis DSM 13258]
MSKDNMNTKFEWKKEYSIVILLNAIYILVFYLIMILNN